MSARTEPKCHDCGLHTEVCSLLQAIQSIVTRVTNGNFQVWLAGQTATRIINRLTGAATA